LEMYEERSMAQCKLNITARLRWVTDFITHPLYPIDNKAS